MLLVRNYVIVLGVGGGDDYKGGGGGGSSGGGDVDDGGGIVIPKPSLRPQMRRLSTYRTHGTSLRSIACYIQQKLIFDHPQCGVVYNFANVCMSVRR